MFNDPEAKKRLEQIVHPEVGRTIAERMVELAQTDEVVVLDIPLLVESGRDDMAATIVVTVPVDVAVARLVEHRGFREADARARMANQVSNEERLAKADFVIDNSGSLEDLDAQVERCWRCSCRYVSAMWSGSAMLSSTAVPARRCARLPSD